MNLYVPNKYISENMTCAYAPNTDACGGDSGGHLSVKDRNTLRYSQIGIVSFGYYCANDYPGVYTSVTALLPWIEKTILGKLSNAWV